MNKQHVWFQRPAPSSYVRKPQICSSVQYTLAELLLQAGLCAGPWRARVGKDGQTKDTVLSSKIPKGRDMHFTCLSGHQAENEGRGEWAQPLFPSGTVEASKPFGPPSP